MDAEQKKAVARLKKMKVYKLIQVDPGRGEPAFDDWWFWVAFETDMLEDECGATLRIHVSADELITDVTNAATTATNLVNASNIVRRLLTSGQVPPEVLEDVQRAEAILTRTTAQLTGGLS